MSPARTDMTGLSQARFRDGCLIILAVTGRAIKGGPRCLSGQALLRRGDVHELSIREPRSLSG